MEMEQGVLNDSNGLQDGNFQVHNPFDNEDDEW